jgi:competence protein ComEA
MNLRLPIVAVVVAAAAGAAAARAFAPPAVPALSVESSANDAPATQALRRKPHHGERAARIVVYVAGEVRHSGMYELPPSSRAFDALRAAGGATRNADLVAVNLAQSLGDGDEVAVPALDAPSAAHSGTRAHRSQRSHGHKKKRHYKRKHSAPASELSDSGSDAPASAVDLNVADESELETLPGVGPELAERIVAFREQAGPYASPDDLLDVAGMTQGKLDAIEPYVEIRVR